MDLNRQIHVFDERAAAPVEAADHRAAIHGREPGATAMTDSASCASL